MQSQPLLFLIAGPNGAGKTTYAFRYIKAVSGSSRFVNLDDIARGLSPLEPAATSTRAARVALDLTRSLIHERRSFSIETTLARRTHLRTLADARASGFKVVLLYFAAVFPEICLARIAKRASEGGHDVLEVDVRRRFGRSLNNLPTYAKLADLWRIFDVTRLSVGVAAEGQAGCVDARNGDGLPVAITTWLDGLPGMRMKAKTDVTGDFSSIRVSRCCLD